jgi:deoxyribose-phosphate aldolase
MKPDFHHIFSIDQAGVEERISYLNTRSLKRDSKTNALKLALSMIDLTTLEGKDTAGKVRQLCYKAMHLHDELPGLPSVAAVCVYPSHIRTARTALKNSTVRIASVATGFPSGNTSLAIRQEETRMAIGDGADEIDMVMNRGAFLSGNQALVSDEIASIKAICGPVCLKVILETGELSSLEQVRQASGIAMQAGADFIKTSTGKIQPAATMPVTLVMLEAIQDFHQQTGRMVGMKPAGGISSAKSALQYLIMLYETLGEAWMSPEYFRFGSSSLANDILLQLGKDQAGTYYSKDYLSLD